MTIERGDLPETVRDELSRRFRFHAANVYHGASPENSSPLYEHLALGIAEEPELLRLLVGLDQHQQFANLFLGTVHLLLLEGARHPLTEFYASLTPVPRPPEEAYPTFYAFCLGHREQIRTIVTTRMVQTNEATRCSSLVPAFGLVAARTGGKPLAIVELGASAGLNLLWDAYAYEYGTIGSIGDPQAAVHIPCELRGPYPPPLPHVIPAVQHRVGIDLAPIDVTDPRATRWLRALVWPEHSERAQRLEAALAGARHSPPPLISGDLAEMLPGALDNVPDDATLCLFHSYTLNHCSRETCEQLETILVDLGQEREVFRISLEYHAPREHPRLVLFAYRQGMAFGEHLAFCESYGRWIEWLQPAASI